jgi:Ala-tRNA(Pro) deacylase
MSHRQLLFPMPNRKAECNRSRQHECRGRKIVALRVTSGNPPHRLIPLGYLVTATPADLFAFLDRLEIPHATVSHPPLFTVEQSRLLRGTIPGGHTKNLFLKDKRGTFVLVVALEEAVIALKGLHRQLGATGRFSFASPDDLREHLGVEPGSVTPFAAINDPAGRVTIVLDSPMLAHEVLNYHPLVNTMTTTISCGGLLKFLTATGHEYRVETVSSQIATAV